jgi:hypothetical protein
MIEAVLFVSDESKKLYLHSETEDTSVTKEKAVLSIIKYNYHT